MNDQQEIDERDPALEALLRATFRSEIARQLPDGRPVPNARALDARPPRRRWVGLSAVAAGLVAAGVTAALVGHEVLDAAPSPTPAATDTGSVIPTTTTSPTSTPTSTASPSSPPTASTSPSAAATRRVTFQGVVLTVPAAWNVVDRPVQSAGETPSICLTTDTTVRMTGIATGDCQLSLSVGAALWGSHDVDRVGFVPDGGLCGTDHRTPHQTDTVVADELVVDGQTAEHRGFTGSCLDQVLDQWTVPTAPFVQFWRNLGPADAAGRAQAVAVVQSARLPGPRSALRLEDDGYLTAVSGTTVSLDRVTSLNQLGIENDNPATYDYPLAADATISYDGSTLSIGQLQDLAAGRTVAGVPPLDALEAHLTTDGSAVTALDLSDRSS